MASEQSPSEHDEGIESGLMSAHRRAPESAHSRPFEVITGSERRRWTVERKQEIVAESLEAGGRPNEVLRKHGITSSQLYTWRQQLTRRLGGKLGEQPTKFAALI
jgi:transposase